MNSSEGSLEARKLGLLGNTSARVVETKKLSRVTLGGLMGVPVDTRLLRAHETVSACAVNEAGQPKDLGDGINHHIPFGSTVTRGGPHPPPQRTLASRCGTGCAGFGLSLEDARPRAPPAGAVLSRGSSHRRPSAYAFGPPCCPPGDSVHCYHLTPHKEVRRGGTEITRDSQRRGTVRIA